MQCMRNNNLDQDCRLLLSSAIITNNKKILLYSLHTFLMSCVINFTKFKNND